MIDVLMGYYFAILYISFFYYLKLLERDYKLLSSFYSFINKIKIEITRELHGYFNYN